MTTVETDMPAFFRKIEEYAAKKLTEHGLTDWSFGWDKARRRLGVCRFKDKQIKLSVYFVRDNTHNLTEIFDTVLHEIAHALAWTRHGDRTHGARWKAICREIGAAPKARAGSGTVRVTTYKYSLRLKTTGRIIACYHRKPRIARHLKRIALIGQPETLGQLELIPWNPEHRVNEVYPPV